MKKVMGIAGIGLGIATLGWWGRKQKSRARMKAGDAAKVKSRQEWQDRKATEANKVATPGTE